MLGLRVLVYTVVLKYHDYRADVLNVEKHCGMDVFHFKNNTKSTSPPVRT